MIKARCVIQVTCDCAECQASKNPLRAEYEGNSLQEAFNKAKSHWYEINDLEIGLIGHIHKDHFKEREE